MVLFALILITCAPATTMHSVWKDDSYQGPLKKVLVVGIAKRPAGKRFFEDEFVRQLKSRGVDAVPGYSVFKDDELKDRDRVAKKVRELGFDAVLVTRMVDKKTVETYVPPTVAYVPPAPYRRGGWHGYYMSGYQYIAEPGYTLKDEVVVVETNVYAADDERLIWSALSETFVEGSPDTLIRSFIQTIVDNLELKKLI